MDREELLKRYTYILEENHCIEELKQDVAASETACRAALGEEDEVPEWSKAAAIVDVILGIAVIICGIGAVQIFDGSYKGWLCLSAVFIMIGLIRIIYTVSCVNHRDGREIEKARIHNEEVIPAYERYEDSRKKLSKKLASSNLVTLEGQIPEDYRTEDAVSFFVQALKNGRADTEKELYNLYEGERHRRKLEAIQEKSLQTLEESLTHCPKCGSTNCAMIVQSNTKTTPFRFIDACCGAVCLGPLGILCGFCGMSSDTTTETYWKCGKCGNKFSS